MMEITAVDRIDMMRSGDQRQLVENVIQNEATADLAYRVHTYERFAAGMNSDHAVIFDDITSGVPVEQRAQLHGLPGYERALLTGVWHAAGFSEGATLVVGAPPMPAEMRMAKKEKQILETELGRSIDYRVMYELQNGEIIDLMGIEDAEEYVDYCRQYASLCDDSTFIGSISHTQHLEIINRHSDSILKGKSNAILPFQLHEYHRTMLEEHEDKVVFPSLPTMNKAINNALLRDHGMGDFIPDMIVVFNDGERNGHYDRLIEKMNTISSIRSEEGNNLEIFAYSVVDAALELEAKGKRAYIKLDADGVSGLGNLDTDADIYARVYDDTLSREDRAEALMSAYRKLKMETIPQAAVVEEYIQTKRIGNVKCDYGVGGSMADGIFYPTSVCPFDTEKGVYNVLWMSSHAADLKEESETWKELYRVAARAAEIFAQHQDPQYRNGIVAMDVMMTEDGGFKIHDYNMRRGGRTTPEQLISTVQHAPLMEAQVEISTEELGLPLNVSNLELFNLYLGLTETLHEKGIQIFANFGYFGRAVRKDGSFDPEHSDFLKMKLVINPDEMRISDKPRARHLEAATKQVLVTARELLTSATN